MQNIRVNFLFAYVHSTCISITGNGVFEIGMM